MGAVNPDGNMGSFVIYTCRLIRFYGAEREGKNKQECILE